MKNKKNTAIVFGLTNNFVFAVASVMMDLKKFNHDWISEIVIIHDGISEDQQKLLNRILPCVFVKYNFPIKNNLIFDQGIFNYFSKMVYSKYECLRLLDNYKNVIWLDYDIVITKDISELADFCESGFKIMLGGDKVSAQLNAPVEEYDMMAEGITASTFVLQDHIPHYLRMYEFCYKKTEQYAKYLYCPEQAIFDFMIQEFFLKPDYIDWNIYSVHPDEINKYNQAKILHSYGHKKFWNEISNENWNSNYKNWLKMGGHGYDFKKYLVKKKIGGFLKKIGLHKNIKNLLIKLKNN